MNILLTNDDGINSEKLSFLESNLKKYGNVYVCAPNKNCSCASHRIKLMSFSKDKLTKLDEFHYTHPGTPADSVRYMLEFTNIKFDIVFSGINDGYNLGKYIEYSGTVGAAFEGIFYGIPSVAISSEYLVKVDEETLNNALTYVFDNSLISSKYLLNINIPDAKNVSDIYFAEIDALNEYNNENFDTVKIKENYITISPIKINRTAYDVLSKFKK